MHASYVGGGFGGKSFCKIEPLVVLLAKKAGRPVRLCLSMDENFLTLSQHSAILVLKTGIQADGLFVARDARIYMDGGAYSDASALVTDKAGYRLPGPYRWTALRTRAFAVRTTSVPAGSFRGFGGTQANFASESQIDMIARRIGLDPLAIRLKNMSASGRRYLGRDSPIDSDFARASARPPNASATASRGVGARCRTGGRLQGWRRRSARRARGGEGDGDRARAGAGRHLRDRARDCDRLCQIAAEILNVPYDWVRYGEIDTDVTPYDQGTHASSGIAVGGNVVARAAQDVREQILGFAAEKLTAAPTSSISKIGRSSGRRGVCAAATGDGIFRRLWV